MRAPGTPARPSTKTGADIFGDPSKGKFAFQFTGHHLTIRCDGDSEEGAAFGGPIYYGHTPNGYHPTQRVRLPDATGHEALRRPGRKAAKARPTLAAKRVQEGHASLKRPGEEDGRASLSDLSTTNRNCWSRS